MTRPGGLAPIDIYVARERLGFFDSQSKAESRNTENFEDGLEYSLHSLPQPHTGHLSDCLHLINTIP